MFANSVYFAPTQSGQEKEYCYVVDEVAVALNRVTLRLAGRKGQPVLLMQRQERQRAFREIPSGVGKRSPIRLTFYLGVFSGDMLVFDSMTGTYELPIGRCLELSLDNHKHVELSGPVMVDGDELCLVGQDVWGAKGIKMFVGKEVFDDIPDTGILPGPWSILRNNALRTLGLDVPVSPVEITARNAYLRKIRLAYARLINARLFAAKHEHRQTLKALLERAHQNGLEKDSLVLAFSEELDRVV